MSLFMWTFLCFVILPVALQLSFDCCHLRIKKTRNRSVGSSGDDPMTIIFEIDSILTLIRKIATIVEVLLVIKFVDDYNRKLSFLKLRKLYFRGFLRFTQMSI